MKFEWDAEKNDLNIGKHGLDFGDAAELFEGPMLIQQDQRQDYGEDRYIAFGRVHGRVVCTVYTERHPDVIRIISFRKANKREQALFQKELQNRLESR